MKKILLSDYLKKYKIRVLFLTILSVVNSVALFVAPSILKVILDFKELDMKKFSYLGMLFFASIIFSYLIHLYTIRFGLKFKHIFKKNESKELFFTFSKLKLARFDEKGATYFSNRIASAIAHLYEFIYSVSSELVVALITVVISLVIAISLSKIVFLLFLILLPTSYYSYKLLNKQLMIKSESLQNVSASNNQRITNMFQNIIFIKQIFNYRRTAKMVANFFSNIQKKENEVNSFAQSMFETINFVTDMIKYAVIFTTIVMYLKGSFSVSDLMFLNMIFNIYFSGLKSLTALNISKRDVGASLEFINNEVLNYSETDSGTNEIGNVNKIDISINQFKYNSSQHDNLRKIEFTIAKGEKIALTGVSGSGKSTLAKLLAYYYHSNTISINDLKLDEYKLESLREKIYLCFQDSFIIPASVEDNITIALKDQKLAHERLAALMKYDFFAKFIDELPNGLDTEMKENIPLSGGQKQKIVLARLLISRPEIIILDESTASLDGDFEYSINNLINEVFKDKIIIKVSHRLSFINDCSKILVFKDGKIETIGSHKSLKESSTEYNRIFKTQLDDERGSDA